MKIEKFIDEWIDGQCRKFRAELKNFDEQTVPLREDYDRAKRNEGRNEALYWNYRLVRRVSDINGYKVPFLSVMEVYYDDTDSITGWVDSEVTPYGESIDEVRQDLDFISQACDRPIIDFDDLPKGLGGGSLPHE